MRVGMRLSTPRAGSAAANSIIISNKLATDSMIPTPYPTSMDAWESSPFGRALLIDFRLAEDEYVLRERAKSAAEAALAADSTNQALKEAFNAATKHLSTGPKNRLTVWRSSWPLNSASAAQNLLVALRDALAHPVRASVVDCFVTESGITMGKLLSMLNAVEAALPP